MTLTYTASTTDGSGIMYYATTSPISNTFTSTSTTLNLTGLVSNRTYTVSLYARQTDASGLSSSITTIIGKTDYNQPTSPGFLTIGYNTSSSVKLFYTASKADASGVVYYANTIPVTSTFTSTTTTMLLTQLSGNTLYTINIYGQIANVRSNISTIYNVTPRGPPSIPTNLSISDVTTTSLTLNYTQSTTDSNSSLIYYATTNPSTTTFTVNNANSMSLTGLSSNTDYTISLYSQQTNTGLNSPIATITTSTAHEPPSTPTFVRVGTVTSSTVTLQYMESTADGPNITYHATTIPETSNFTSTTNRLTLIGLSSNTFYQISLYAEIGGVNSLTSAIFTCRKVFSKSFAASATSGDDTSMT
jgi:chitinase